MSIVSTAHISRGSDGNHDSVRGWGVSKVSTAHISRGSEGIHSFQKWVF